MTIKDMSEPRLIGLDWGTTSCRAYLIGTDGKVLDRVTDGPGILRVENGAFGAALDAMIGGWGAKLPVILSGMIGSRQGWLEAPYAQCPASADDIVTALVRIAHADLQISLVPGLSTENDSMPDVMRGEETQIFGALALSGRDGGLFLLPGTHSKWAEVSAGRIVSFRTFMTGEVFGALKDHTILARLMRGDARNSDGFARGVREGAALGSAGALLNRVFATRTYGLTDRLADTALSDYLSGLLIGAEVAEATKSARGAVTIIASAALAARYTDALRVLGHRNVLAPDDCAAAGHWRIARAAGLC
jgi:2-dehydro-3-deoxygalactonokinase